jgi:hypothetical protein
MLVHGDPCHIELVQLATNYNSKQMCAGGVELAEVAAHTGRTAPATNMTVRYVGYRTDFGSSPPCSSLAASALTAVSLCPLMACVFRVSGAGGSFGTVAYGSSVFITPSCGVTVLVMFHLQQHLPQ